MNIHTRKRGSLLAIAAVTLFFAGILYAWSILKAPLAAGFGWDSAALALNFTLTMCCFCLGGLFSGLLGRRIPARLRLLCAAVLVAGGFFAVSRLSGQSLLPLYLAYGVAAGAGIGVIYNTVISTTSAWFPDKKGLCSGVMMMAFGFSTLILGKLAGALMNAPSVGWRGTFRILGAAIGLVTLAAALLLKAPGPDDTLPQAPAKTALTGTRDFSAAEMLRRPSFYKLFLFFILLSSVGSTAISFARDFFLSVGVAEGAAVTTVGLLSVCNGLGRLASGALFDAKGLRATQMATSAAAIAGPALALAALLTELPLLGIAGMCICGFSYGFSPTLSAAFASAFYGQKNFALNFSLLNLVLIPGSFVATLAGTLVTRTGSYLSTFLLLLAFSLVGLPVNLTIKEA